MKAFFAISILIIAGLFSCKTRTALDLSSLSIIPKPIEVIPTHSSFILSETTNIYLPEASRELEQIGSYLVVQLDAQTGLNLTLAEAQAPSNDNFILLKLNPAANKAGAEGYELTITEDLIEIAAATPAGLFYGVQTLLQVVPIHQEENPKVSAYEIATGTIKDGPVYSYRGAMLDVARHFFNVEDVKRYIDLLAVYKINNLHLHLSDDQGWRIEIKSWPNLATHGGSSEVGGGEAGYYTHEQYKEIVNHAMERFITIIPEIDMPGHTNAALASYAELNCDGKARDLYTGTEVGFSTLCTDKEITYQFVDDVVRELADLTPGEYIHIGGDESHATPMEDYIPFMERVQDIVESHGKKVMGWDEIANASLKENTVIQYWAKAENALAGVQKGAKVLISPATRTYLDMQYDSTTALGLHWAAYIEVDSAYTWEPTALVPGVGKENIIGVESPLWTETITTMDELEYMVFPRIVGHAEIGWTEPSARSWDEFKIRLGNHCKRFEMLGINYYPSTKVPWK
ncbi:MAG: beta-N-acetylhexosaminidase [Cyclobacteriaceae bacterium]|nr:beta-N-acetylhexosaminidase [Cyclobacteriaceae bacterium]